MNEATISIIARIIKSLLLPLLIGSAITVPILAATTNNAPRPLTAADSPESSETPTVTSTLTGTQTITATATPTLTETVTVTATPPMTGTVEANVTICHRTGSASNPYVEITVSRNALPAHAAHGDIIPAPAGGCPTSLSGTPSETVTATSTATSTPTGTPAASPTTSAQMVTICHATGSASNPYVLITVDVNGLNGHRKHPRDIIPAPAGGCPTSPQQPSAVPPGKSNGGGNSNNGNGNGGGNGNGTPPGNGNQNNHGSKKP